MPGGKNSSKNRMDMLISNPTVKVINKGRETVTIVKNGLFQV